MQEYEQMQFFVQLDQCLYDDIKMLLSSHSKFTDKQGKELRDIIKRVATRLQVEA